MADIITESIRMFGKWFNKAKSEVAKVTKRDLMEASVACGVLVMYADGDATDNEVEKLLTVLQTMPSLSEFQSDIPSVFEKYSQLMSKSARMGKLELMKQIRDCEHDKAEAEQILIVGLDVSDADGLSAEEEDVLKNIATTLGLNIAEYA